MSTLNVMKGSEIKPSGKVHVDTKNYHNAGSTVGLVFSDDFSSFTISIQDKEVAEIILTKVTAGKIKAILGVGLV